MIKRNNMYFLFLFVTSLTLPLNDCTLYTVQSGFWSEQVYIICRPKSTPILLKVYFSNRSVHKTAEWVRWGRDFLIFSTLDSEQLLHHFWSCSWLPAHIRTLPCSAIFFLTIFRQRETEPVWDKVHVHFEMSAVSILGANPRRWWQPSLETAARQKRTPHDLWKWRCLCLCPNFALFVHLHFCKLHPKTFFGAAWFVRWIALTVSCNDWQVEVQPPGCLVQQMRR